MSANLEEEVVIVQGLEAIIEEGTRKFHKF